MRALERNYSDFALHLSDQHFQTLWLLARARLTGAPVNSYEIANFIYENRPQKNIDDLVHLENTVSAEMSALRGLVGVFSEDTVFVQNKKGVGYKLVLLGEGPFKKRRGSSSARNNAQILKFSHRAQ
jgi:DNA-binding response OmpR family regulator